MRDNESTVRSYGEAYGDEALDQAMARGGDLFDDTPMPSKPYTRLEESIARSVRERLENDNK